MSSWRRLEQQRRAYFQALNAAIDMHPVERAARVHPFAVNMSRLILPALLITGVALATIIVRHIAGRRA